MQNKFIKLREKHPIFTYEKYEITDLGDRLVITYFFHLGEDIIFTPTWEFKKKHTYIDYSQEEIVNKLAFNLGLVELISYWKCACSPLLKIEAGYIDAEQIDWWKQQYYLGLGEFFYTNGIETSLSEFMKIEVVGEEADDMSAEDVAESDSITQSRIDNIGSAEDVADNSSKAEHRTDIIGSAEDMTENGSQALSRTDNIGSVQDVADYTNTTEVMVKIRTNYEKSGCLIPIGGGKDSIVTLELLSDRKSSNLCFMINKKEASERCASVAGYSENELLIVNRSLDKKLLELNKEGYLNGHTPFSAIVAFSSVLAAWLYDKKYVVLSNESSANESTVEGTMVNHQYSKSFKFEKDFTDYEAKYIGSEVFYFSLLRPFAELQIAKHFSLHEKYYEIFRSCNVGSKVDKWCGHCPKCLFVYIILYPFISTQRLIEIFGSDMLNDESLISTFDKLIGLVPEKPFECVGTCDEANTAVCMTIQKLTENRKELPRLYQYYMDKGLYAKNFSIENPYSRYYNEENQVPEEFIERLKALMLSE